MTAQPTPSTFTPVISKDHYGAMVAHDIIAAERQYDVLLGRLGQVLTTLADGRVPAGLRAKAGQRALERYSAVIKHAVDGRGELVAFHAGLARTGHAEGIHWTTLGGPTETTPDTPVKGLLTSAGLDVVDA